MTRSLHMKLWNRRNEPRLRFASKPPPFFRQAVLFSHWLFLKKKIWVRIHIPSNETYNLPPLAFHGPDPFSKNYTPAKSTCGTLSPCSLQLPFSSNASKGSISLVGVFPFHRLAFTFSLPLCSEGPGSPFHFGRFVSFFFCVQAYGQYTLKLKAQ